MKQMNISAAILVSFIMLMVAGCELLDDEGQEKVRYFLKDPKAAEFRNARKIIKDQGASKEAVFCGEVNSKNSYGAFTGIKKYFVLGRLVIIEGDNGVIYDVPKPPCTLCFTEENEAVRHASETSARATLWVFKTKAELINMRKKNEDRRNGLDTEDGTYNVTAFDIAWDEQCKQL